MKNYKYNKDKYLQRVYGITLKEYKALLKNQKYKCAICGKKQKDCKQALDVDHSHKDGKVRGLLCRFCNSKLLRYLRDDKNRAKGLASYLNEYYI